MADPLSTAELYERLRRHVLGKDDEQGGRAFLFPEVEIGDRRADGVSFGLWASRGFPIQAYELKKNRRDWLAEYEDHGKADPAMAVCDYFWIVTNPEVVEPDELPDKWGLLVSQGRGRKLKIVKRAPLLREGEPPLPRAVMAEIFKGVKALHYSEAERIRREAKEQADESGDVRVAEKRRQRAEDRAEEMSKAFTAFKRESGLDFLKWQPEHEELEMLGKMVKALRGGAYSDEFDEVRKMLKRDMERMGTARGFLKRAAEAMDEMEEREWRRSGKQPPEKEEGF